MPTGRELRKAFAIPEDAFSLSKPIQWWPFGNRLLDVSEKELKADPGYAVYKMMRRYEILYEDAAKEQKHALIKSATGRRLALLRIVGLFDRPSTWSAFQSILDRPVIEGLTERLSEVTQGEWQEALSGLRSDGLLNPSVEGRTVLSDDHMIDAHPLIREYFARRLQVIAPAAFRAAHRRLFNYYRFSGLPSAFRQPAAYGLLELFAVYPKPLNELRNVSKDGKWPADWQGYLPPSLKNASQKSVAATFSLIDGPDWSQALAAFLPTTEENIAPVLHAISHGCYADEHEEAFNRVFWPRVERGNSHYSTRELGLYGPHLAAIANFFAEPFLTPAATLSSARKALVFNQAGFDLRALGRLREAVQPFRAGLKVRVETSVWDSASAGASNLSELLATLGKLGGNESATDLAERAVKYALLDGNNFLKIRAQAVLADVCFQNGEWERACKLFTEAESDQRKTFPRDPLLHSVDGYRWCELKLAQGRSLEVVERCNQYLEGVTPRNRKSKLGLALATLTLGRAEQAINRLASARALLDQAVQRLRDVGDIEFIARGLLARAAYYRVSGDYNRAERDLQGADGVASRAGMRLIQADSWLESARLYLARNVLDGTHIGDAEAALGKAMEAINDTHYLRRNLDLTLLRAEVGLARGNTADANPLIEKSRNLMVAHNLWGFLPELDRLVANCPSSLSGSVIGDLGSKRSQFDLKADQAFVSIDRTTAAVTQ